MWYGVTASRELWCHIQTLNSSCFCIRRKHCIYLNGFFLFYKWLHFILKTLSFGFLRSVYVCFCTFFFSCWLYAATAERCKGYRAVFTWNLAYFLKNLRFAFCKTILIRICVQWNTVESGPACRIKASSG